ncbi:MAG: DegV family protein [Gammaproteobacteria bacterium]
MRVGVIIDSACDLPPEFIEKEQIQVLPINLYLGEEQALDVRDPGETIAFYQRFAAKKWRAATEPPSVEQVTETLLERAATQFDRLLIVTISSTRSGIFENVTKAQLPLLNAVRQKRNREGIKGSFFLRVHDSKTLFTGQAVLVHEMVRLLREEGLGFDELCRRADVLSGNIRAFLVPEDLYFVRKRASKKGESSISWLRYQTGTLLDIRPVIRAHRGETEAVVTARGFERALGKLLDMAAEAVEQGLKTNTIAMSYAGDPQRMWRHPLVRRFVDHALSHGIEVLQSVMSTTAGVHVGPGAFSLAYAAD